MDIWIDQAERKLRCVLGQTKFCLGNSERYIQFLSYYEKTSIFNLPGLLKLTKHLQTDVNNESPAQNEWQRRVDKKQGKQL